MRYKTFIKYAALAVVIPLNAAGNWGVVSSWPAPCFEPRGLWAGYLVGDGAKPYVYYPTSAWSPSYSSFPAPGGPGAWGISEADVEYEFYLSNNRTSWIYKITSSGSVLNSFLCPIPCPADIGYAWGTRLEVSIPNLNVIAVVNPKTGSLVSTIPAPGLWPTSCAGYGAMFITDGRTHTVYRARRAIIEGIENPTGISYAEWIVDTNPRYDVFVVDAATKYIYMYQDNVHAGPASLGRVKALFR
jgi:hypothetical protein